MLRIYLSMVWYAQGEGAHVEAATFEFHPNGLSPSQINAICTALEKANHRVQFRTGTGGDRYAVTVSCHREPGESIEATIERRRMETADLLSLAAAAAP